MQTPIGSTVKPLGTVLWTISFASSLCVRTVSASSPDLSDGQPPAQPWPASTGAAPGYVGETACASCHPDIARSYREVGMAQSFYRPSADHIIEGFRGNHFYHAPSKRHYEMSHRDGAFYVTRYQTDSDGTRYNEWAQRIDYVIGSGHHSRGYVYLNPSGEMFQLPIAWYTQEKRWAMAPGYDGPAHDDFSRPVTRACLFCHNAYPQVPAGSDRYGQPNRFPRVLPEGIGCERCHGPGAEHVRRASDKSATPGRVREAIVNPARLSLQLQDDVCMQCHLQPTSKLTSFIRRFGVGDYSYVPGQPLDEYLVYFEFDTELPDEDRFEIDSAGYRLRQSRCFQAGKGALTCTTCHDPHRRVPASQVARHYRERCFTCHSQDACGADDTAHQRETVAPDDCTACHMPKRRTEDVIHVVMTDHRIQRHCLPGNLLAPLAETPSPRRAVARFLLPDRAPSGAEAELYLALPAIRDGTVVDSQPIRRTIDRLSRDTIEPYIELATAELARGMVRDALEHWTQVLRIDSTFAPGHVNRGVALSGLGEEPQALLHFGEALRLDPQLPDAHYNIGSTLARMGRDEEARGHYEKALQLRPHYAKCRFNLANLLARNGDLSEAVRQYREALVIDPDYAAAYENLGVALRLMDDWPEAIRTWNRGLSQFPDNGDIAEALALALLAATQRSCRDDREGLAVAIRAADADRSNGDRALIVALGLLRNARHKEALERATRAVQLGADPAEGGLVAAMAMQGLDDPRADVRYAEALAAVPRNAKDGTLRRALINAAAEVFGQSRNPPGGRE